MNPNNSCSLCRHALNDPGPKFNTHLGHSCGTVPAHLGGINIREEQKDIKKKKKKGSPLNIHRDGETTLGNPAGTTGLKIPKVRPAHNGQHLLLTPEAGGLAGPQGAQKIQGQANLEAGRRGCPATVSLGPCHHHFLSVLEPAPHHPQLVPTSSLCFHVLLFCLDQRFSKSGLLTSSISIPGAS